MDVRPSILITITNTFKIKSGNPQGNTKMHKNGTYICECHFFCVILQRKMKVLQYFAHAEGICLSGG